MVILTILFIESHLWLRPMLMRWFWHTLTNCEFIVQCTEIGKWMTTSVAMYMAVGLLCFSLYSGNFFFFRNFLKFILIFVYRNIHLFFCNKNGLHSLCWNKFICPDLALKLTVKANFSEHNPYYKYLKHWSYFIRNG